MRIAYWTTDVVNENLAYKLAEVCGATLYPLAPRDANSKVDFDAVLYDVDSLPAELRHAILAELGRTSAPYPLAVHSYGLDARQVATLSATTASWCAGGWDRSCSASWPGGFTTETPRHGEGQLSPM